MARTVGCRDLGVNCDFRVTDEDGQDEFILDKVLEHASAAHAEALSGIPNVREEVRKHLKSLVRQSHYSDEAQAQA
jgi:predicted small metal-binding protein